MTETVRFNSEPIGSKPKGWTITMTGRSEPRWTIEKDDTAPSKFSVLKQSGTATFPLALEDGTNTGMGLSP